MSQCTGQPSGCQRCAVRGGFFFVESFPVSTGHNRYVLKLPATTAANEFEKLNEGTVMRCLLTIVAVIGFGIDQAVATMMEIDIDGFSQDATIVTFDEVSPGPSG